MKNISPLSYKVLTAAGWLALGAVVGFGAGLAVERDPVSSESFSTEDRKQHTPQLEDAPGEGHNPRVSSASDAVVGDAQGGVDRRENLSAWMRSHPEEARAWLIGLPTGAEKLRAVREWARMKAETDPLAALEFVAEHTVEPPSSGIYQDILISWGRRDLTAALGWVAGVQSDADRRMLGSFVLGGVQADDAASVLAVLPQVTDAWLRDALVTRTATALAGTSPEAAWAWVGQLPSADRKRPWEAVLAGMGSENPLMASQYLAKCGGEVDRVMAVAVLAGQWGHRDPNAAAGWVLGLDDEAERRSAMQPLITAWAQMEPGEAAAWLSKLSPGDVRDNGLITLARSMASWDATGALAQAREVGQSELRDEAVIHIIRSWTRRDPGAAKAWVESNPAPPQFGNRLRKVVGLPLVVK